MDSLSNVRRAGNRNQPLTIDNFGDLRPLSDSPGEKDGFWRGAILAARKPDAPRLAFIPFELDLTQRFERRRPSFESILDQTLAPGVAARWNPQLSGRLRVYPVGVGVVRMALTLEFPDEVLLDAVARIAREIEELVFIHPEGGSMPASDLILDVIGPVIRFLFAHDNDLRWRPPEIIYGFNRFDPAGLEAAIDQLSFLMAETRGNDETEAAIAKRLQLVFRSKDWTEDGVFAVASQRTSLLLLSSRFGNDDDAKRKSWSNRLQEACELAWAIVYLRKAVTEQIAGLADSVGFELEVSRTEDLELVRTRLEFARDALRASDAAKDNLKKLGSSIFPKLAATIVTLNDAVDRSAVVDQLTRILAELKDEVTPRLTRYVLDRFQKDSW